MENVRSRGLIFFLVVSMGESGDLIGEVTRGMCGCNMCLCICVYSGRIPRYSWVCRGTFQVYVYICRCVGVPGMCVYVHLFVRT